MLIEDVLASGEKSGYVFKYQRISNETYSIVARPKQFGTAGTRNFFTDQSGVIRVTNEDREATVNDEPLE